MNKEKFINKFIVMDCGYLLYLLEYDKENRVIIGNSIKRDIDNIEEFFYDEIFEHQKNVLIISLGINKSFSFMLAKGRDFYSKLQRPTLHTLFPAPKRSWLFKILFPMKIKQDEEYQEFRVETHEIYKTELEDFIKQKSEREKKINYIDQILDELFIQ